MRGRLCALVAARLDESLVLGLRGREKALVRGLALALEERLPLGLALLSCEVLGIVHDAALALKKVIDSVNVLDALVDLHLGPLLDLKPDLNVADFKKALSS